MTPPSTLPDAERRLAALVESSDDAIVSKDLHGTVTTWNRAAERLFGYTADEMIGQSIRRVIPDDRQAEEDDTLARIRRGEHLHHFETWRQRKDGSLVPISLTVSPIVDAEGRVVGASKIARDISDRWRAETERAEAAREIERLYNAARDANRLKDQFLATLSHELRTPLNAIVGYARMLRSGVLDGDRMRQAHDVIDRNATSLTQIVDDVLDVSRIISGKVRLNMQTTDMVAVVRDALATIEPVAEQKRVRLHVTYAADPALITGDPERMQQVIWNLLSNAVKFTSVGGDVRIEFARSADHIEIVVSDTGMGIEPEFLPHVFERFRQGDGTSSGSRTGLGLGLAIVRSLIEAHGGTVTAESEGRGRGATFRVVLPLLSATPAEIPADPAVPARARAAAAGFASLDGVRVLVVDDDADALDLAREILISAGADVRVVDSATAALSVLSSFQPDVLLSDLGMPQIDGFELVQRVRALSDRALHGVAALALSAYARNEDRARALNAGFQMHMSKPVDPHELVAAVAELASR